MSIIQVGVQLIMADKQTQKENKFGEYLKQAEKRGNEWTREMKKKIHEDDQKIRKIQREKEEKAAKVARKSQSQQYIQNQIQDLEVPVDGDLEKGSRSFMIHCSSCHGMQAQSVQKKMGPSLGLIFNRKIGSDPEYEAYSPQMIKNNHFWSARNLYRFMLNPQSIVKSTYCKISALGYLKSEEERADLLQFLKRYSEELTTFLKIQEVKKKGYYSYQTTLYTDQMTGKDTPKKMTTTKQRQ